MVSQYGPRILTEVLTYIINAQENVSFFSLFLKFIIILPWGSDISIIITGPIHSLSRLQGTKFSYSYYLLKHPH